MTNPKYFYTCSLRDNIKILDTSSDLELSEITKQIDEKRNNEFPTDCEQTTDSLNNSLNEMLYGSWNSNQVDDAHNFYEKYNNFRNLSRKKKKQKTKFLKQKQKNEYLNFTPDHFLKSDKVSKNF
jgi:hypothetical protein